MAANACKMASFCQSEGGDVSGGCLELFHIIFLKQRCLDVKPADVLHIFVTFSMPNVHLDHHVDVFYDKKTGL